MAVIIKNKKAYDNMIKTTGKYENLAIKSYKANKMKIGAKYEKKADDIYKKTYNSIFKVTKE